MPLDKLTYEEKYMLMSIFECSERYKAELRNMTKGRKKAEENNRKTSNNPQKSPKIT